MKMSDKLNSIYDLVEVDNKDAIVSEIKALRNFTDVELASIFGSSNILWILENYTVKELKDLARKVEDSIEIREGDIFTFKDDYENNRVGIILSIQGIKRDRCTALCYSSYFNHYKIQEGISAFDINILGNGNEETFSDVISSLHVKMDSENTLVDGGDL